MSGWRASFGRRLLGGLMMLAVLSPAAAIAHATLVGSMPGDGSVVGEAPTAFHIAFNEPVAVTGLKLSGGGHTVTLERFRTDGATIEIEAPSNLAKGSYALSYRVVSEDGHPIAGAVSFSIGAPGGGPAPELDPGDPMLDAAIWAARLALYVGLLLGAGGAFALAWLSDNGAGGKRTVLTCTLVGLAAAPVALALQGADLVGAPLDGAFAPVIWRQALGTTYAWTVAASAVLLVAALLSLASRACTAKVLSACALGGVGVALAASGHASAASPQALMRTAVFVHGVAAAFWIGALVPLFVALGNDTSSAVRSLRRFSSAAPYAVAALAVAGTVLAVRQIETVSALWTTDYGLVLLAKLGLVAILFVLAAANRWRWTRATLDGAAATRRSLRRSVAAELVIGALVLGVVALWRFTPPPRSLAIQSAQPAIAHLQTQAAQADITIAPGRVGKSDVTVMVMTGDFGPLDAKQLTFVISNPAAGMEAIRRDARKRGDGTWRVDAVQLAAAGEWVLRVEILVTDFDLERLEGRIDIRP